MCSTGYYINALGGVYKSADSEPSFSEIKLKCYAPSPVSAEDGVITTSLINVADPASLEPHGPSVMSDLLTSMRWIFSTGSLEKGIYKLSYDIDGIN